MKTVVLLVDSSGFGGIESHLFQLSRLCQKKSVDSQVVFLRSHTEINEHPLVKRLMKCGIACFFLSGHFRDWLQFCRKKGPQIVVHAHGYKAILWARLSCRLFCVPCVSTYHAGEKTAGRVAFYQSLMYGTGFLSNNLVVSSLLLMHLRTHFLPNFIEIPAAQCRDRHERLQIGFVGRADFVKGLDRFLTLANEGAQWDWHVFGGERGSRSSSVIEHGVVEDMENQWQFLDVLLMPSRAEGFPMAALEALAHGVPVLATDVGELPRLLPEVWLVRESNWQALIEKLHELDNDNWRQSSRLASTIVAKNYSSDMAWETLKKFYDFNGNGL